MHKNALQSFSVHFEYQLIENAKYLAVQNGAEEVCFVDLLTGGQNHFHLVVVAQSAGMVEVYSTQVLDTGEII